VFDKIKEYIFHKAVIRAVEAVAKFTVAWMAQPQVISILDKAGIHIDSTKFGSAVTGGLLFAVAWVYHLYIQHQQEIAKLSPK
jgi:hypothetical protein